MAAHAFLAPSSAPRWVRCALAPTMEAAYPETEDSPASMEGTAAHWAVQMLLQGTPAAEGVQAPNGVAVTRDMLEGAELVQTDIAGKCGRNWQDALFIERPVRIHRVHPSLNWGTPDYVHWSDRLRIWDYKYGHGIVEVFENWQLLDYAAGILGDAYAEDLIIEFTIIQPRAFHRAGPVRNWSIRASDLATYVTRLNEAAALATGANPPANPTPEGCEHCTGRHACEALQRAAYFAADHAGRYGALELSPHALGLELRNLTRARALLDARISGLEAQTVASIKGGNLVPFWLMEAVPGRLAWTKPAPEVFALGDMLGLNLRKAPEPMTPTQAKAAAKVAAKAAGMAADTYDALIDNYASRPAGAAKLIADDGSKARLIFGKM